MKIMYNKRSLRANGLTAPNKQEAELGYFLFVEGVCYFGVLPPYRMLNKTLMSGRLVSANNTLLEWQPQRLSRLDYEDLKDSIQDNPQWGGEVDEDFRGSRKYWDRWAMLRSISKMSAYS